MSDTCSRCGAPASWKLKVSNALMCDQHFNAPGLCQGCGRECARKDLRWWTLLQLKSGSSERRQQAAETLGASNDSRAIGPLVAALGDKHFNVRHARIRGISSIAHA